MGAAFESVTSNFAKGKGHVSGGNRYGSSTTKTVVMENDKIVKVLLMNTGFNCREIAEEIYPEGAPE